METCATNRAFSLIELLVAMALLSLIVLGLLIMFNQTQRAFRAGLGQTDILEGGRGAIDVLVREIEQMTPCEAPNLAGPFQNGSVTPMVNFWSGYDPNFGDGTLQLLAPAVPPANVNLYRTNVIRQFFFLSKYNQDWNAVLYRVQPDMPGSAVGSLYRYATVWPRYTPLTVGYTLLRNNVASTNLVLNGFPITWTSNRVADGIIHLRLRAFDTNGVALIPYNSQYLCAPIAPPPYPYRPSVNNASGYPYSTYRCDYCFWSNAVPAYLELEMGVLDPKTLQHYHALDPSTPAAANYLSNHVGQVYLFRQRIAIRNVDFSAYQ